MSAFRTIATGVIALVALGGCTAKHPKSAAGQSTTTTAKVEKNFPVVHVALAPLDANNTKPAGDDVIAKVQATLDRYVADAVVAPLRTAAPPPDLSAVFTGNVLARITPGSPERASLVDEGFPAASTAITPDAANAVITSVAGPDEVPGLIGVHLDLKIHAVGPTADFDVVHSADFVFIDDADAGEWKIDAFQAHAGRDSRPPATATTTKKSKP